MRAAVANIDAYLTAAALYGAADAALLGEHWEVLLDIARRIPAPRQREWARIVGRYGEVDPQLLERLQRRAAQLGFGDSFLQDEVSALVA